MDVGDNVPWGELLKQAADRDKWRQGVAKLICKAKGIEWVQSKKRVKEKRQALKQPNPPTPPTSAFTFHTRTHTTPKAS